MFLNTRYAGPHACLCSKMTELTPRRIDPRRRESIEESGMAVVGSGAGMSSFDANRLRCAAQACTWSIYSVEPGAC